MIGVIAAKQNLFTGFVITLCFSFPLYSKAIITSLDSLLFGASCSGDRSGMSCSRRTVLASTVVGSMIFIECFEPPLESVLGLTGAIGGCALVYVFPGLFYDKVLEARGGSRLALALAMGGGVLGILCAVSILVY